MPTLRARAFTVPTHRQLDPSASASWGLPRLFGGGGRRPDAAALQPHSAETSLTDRLTGAGNAASWDQSLQAAIANWAALPITMIRLALNTPQPQGLAEVRNEHDPERNLVLAAVRWQEILRPGDHLARIDETEFGVLLPRCGPEAAGAVVQRLLNAVPDGVICAVGLATWDGEESLGAFQARADAELELQRPRLTADPYDDPARLAAVAATGLAVRATQTEFDEIASSVAWLLATPIVVITLFDDAWQTFIGAHGVAEAGGPLSGAPAEDAICRQTVSTGRPVVVNDTRRHPVLQHIPPVTDLGVIACASVPITTDDGHVIGSVCAMVLERHTWTADDVALLKLTARRVSDRLAYAPVPLTTA